MYLASPVASPFNGNGAHQAVAAAAVPSALHGASILTGPVRHSNNNNNDHIGAVHAGIHHGARLADAHSAPVPNTPIPVKNSTSPALTTNSSVAPAPAVITSTPVPKLIQKRFHKHHGKKVNVTEKLHKFNMYLEPICQQVETITEKQLNRVSIQFKQFSLHVSKNSSRSKFHHSFHSCRSCPIVPVGGYPNGTRSGSGTDRQRAPPTQMTTLSIIIIIFSVPNNYHAARLRNNCRNVGRLGMVK